VKRMTRPILSRGNADASLVKRSVAVASWQIGLKIASAILTISYDAAFAYLPTRQGGYPPFLHADLPAQYQDTYRPPNSFAYASGSDSTSHTRTRFARGRHVMYAQNLHRVFEPGHTPRRPSETGQAFLDGPVEQFAEEALARHTPRQSGRPSSLNLARLASSVMLCSARLCRSRWPGSMAIAFRRDALPGQCL